MGLAYSKQLSDSSLLGLWHLSESLTELLAHYPLKPEELPEFEKRKNEKRKKEWLATRLLLGSLLDSTYFIRYGTNGKPYLSPSTHHISLSHSGDYVAIILNANSKNGIDIQYIKPSICSGKEYFLSDREIGELPYPENAAYLTTYWCAKECLYKYADTDLTDLKNNLYILPFSPQTNGMLQTRILSPEYPEVIPLHYHHLDDYVLVYTSDSGVKNQKIEAIFHIN